jgi:hypothetical protein
MQKGKSRIIEQADFVLNKKYRDKLQQHSYLFVQ